MNGLSSVADRYDHALRFARHTHLPPGTPVPRPTAFWPPENVALLAQYRDWLLSSGASLEVVKLIYLPTAGHVLGLSLKPHPQLDLDTDLKPALAYLKAKRLSSHWSKVCRNALLKFRLFLSQQRGQLEVAFASGSPDLSPYWTGLPDWLVEALRDYQRLMQPHWQANHPQQRLLSFWNSHTRLWRWLFEHYPLAAVSDIKRQYLLDYIDHGLAQKYAISTINNHLRCFQATLRYLQQQEVLVPQVLLRLPGLKQPDRLPRALTDEQVRQVRADLEARVAQAHSLPRQRDALLDRAAFYLLWQGGLRLGEVEALRLEALDLAGHQVRVRQGKGLKDRTVYLTQRAVAALEAYLEWRGQGGSDHLFLYRHRSLRKDLIRDRLHAAGKRAGVKVSPHRLRHTCATQLLNAGCRVTSIQKLLGHRRLNSTMIYARVHDRTVAEDYYTAMAAVENRLELALLPTERDDLPRPLSPGDRACLLELALRLAEPQLEPELRLPLAEQICHLLQAAGELIPEAIDTGGRL